MSSQDTHFQFWLLDLLEVCYAVQLEIAGVEELCLEWWKKLKIQAWIESWGLHCRRRLDPEVIMGARVGL